MPKCGTTDLWYKINAHPFIANYSKEPHWWARKRIGKRKETWHTIRYFSIVTVIRIFRLHHKARLSSSSSPTKSSEVRSYVCVYNSLLKNKPSLEYFVSSTATSLHFPEVQISSDCTSCTWNEQMQSITKKGNKLVGFRRLLWEIKTGLALR